MDSNVQVAVISAFSIIVVAAIGYLATKNKSTNDRVKELEREVSVLQEEIKEYKRTINSYEVRNQSLQNDIIHLTNENITLMKRILLTEK